MRYGIRTLPFSFFSATVTLSVLFTFLYLVKKFLYTDTNKVPLSIEELSSYLLLYKNKYGLFAKTEGKFEDFDVVCGFKGERLIMVVKSTAENSKKIH